MGQLSDNHSFLAELAYDCYFLVLLRMFLPNGTCLDQAMISVEK